MAVVLIAVLVLGAFGGTTFIAHAHDGHQTHLHVGPSRDAAMQLGMQHRLAHAAGHADCGEHYEGGDHDRRAHDPEPTHVPDSPASTEEPDDVSITIPDHDQLVTRGVDLARMAKVAACLACASAWVWNPPDVTQEVGSPGGRGGGRLSDAPLHLSSLKAMDRLVRTSSALLL